MRTFIAVDFDSRLKKQIARLQTELRLYAASGRWKHVDNFHLTLKFLGEIKPDAIPGIDDKLRDICINTGRFRLKISEMGVFPGRDMIRVLWLGIQGDLDKIQKLQFEIESSFEELGFARERRRYTPHVTIGQDIRFDRDFQSIKELFDPDLKEFPGILADRIYLFKSEQIGNKRVYTPISEYRFGK